MPAEQDAGLHKHKHHIRVPLLAFIGVLGIIVLVGGSLFYIQNKPYLQQKILETEEQEFQVDHLLLKVLLKEREFAQQEIRILNTGQREQEFSLSVEGLTDIVSLDSSSFSLLPGQTKVVTAHFSTADTTRGIEHYPGVYAGMLSVLATTKQEIPLLVEIETSPVFFDTNLNPISLENKVVRGENMVIEVRLFNLQSIDAQNVDMLYAVKDMRGNTLLTERETVVVKTQASFFKTISIPPSIASGTYVFIAETRVLPSIGTSSYLFEVVDPKIEQSTTLKSFCVNDPPCTGLSIALLVLLLAVVAYFYLFVGAYFYQKVSSFFSPQASLRKQAEAEREKATLERERLRIAKSKQRMAFLKMVLFGRKEKGVIKTITKTKSILDINKLLEQGHGAIKQNKLTQARSIYQRAIQKYEALSIEEKKGIYPAITSFYRSLVEAENAYHRHERLLKQPPLLVRLGLVKSAEERDKERRAKEKQLVQQRKVAEIERKQQEAKAAEQERLRQQEQRKQEAERRKAEAQQKKQEEQQRKEEAARQKLIEEEQKKRQAELEAQERLRQEQLKAREAAHKQKQEVIKQEEQRIKKLEQSSLEIAQQIENAMQELSTITLKTRDSDAKHRQRLLKKHEQLQQKVRRFEQRHATLENELLKARKYLLKAEGGLTNTIKLLFMPTSYTPKPRKLPQVVISKKKPLEKTRVEKETESIETQSEREVFQATSFVQHFSKENLAKKSSAFRKYKKAIAEAESAANKGDMKKAKASYAKARELYLTLEYAERTEVYNELNTVYKHLSGR